MNVAAICIKILHYIQTIQNNDFKNYEEYVQNKAVSSIVKSERDDVYFEDSFLNQHFKSQKIVTLILKQTEILMVFL